VRQVPIHMIKDSTIPQTRSSRRLLDIDETGIADERELSLFAQSGSEDEIDAPRRSQTCRGADYSQGTARAARS